MKVLLINGSPHAAGCTYTALSEVAKEINAAGIETEIAQIGMKPAYGCVGCGKCRELGRCVFDDVVNELAAKLVGIDGLVLGSPVYYAGPNGIFCAILDRLFFSARDKLIGKPGAAIVNCRRGGASAAFDRLNKYFTILKMPVVSSQYWNGTHGFTPDDMRQDLEGMQTMRTLGKNMAYLVKALKDAPKPEYEPQVMTNFIR